MNAAKSSTSTAGASKTATSASSGANKTSNTGAASSAKTGNSVAGSVSASPKLGTDNGNSVAKVGDKVSVSEDSKTKETKSAVNLDAWGMGDASKETEAKAADPKAEEQTKANADLAASLGEKNLKSGMHDESVRSLQAALNDKLGLELSTDGKYGPKTKEAVMDFQRKNGLEPVDGVVGPKTKAALTGINGEKAPDGKAEEAKAPDAKAPEDAKVGKGEEGAEGKPVDDTKAPGDGKLSFGQKLSAEQKGAVNQMVTDLKAKGFDVKADDIVNFMAVETGGTFSPSIRSGGSKNGAVGLAQFTGIAIKDMNRFRSKDQQLTKEKLSKMSFSEQSKVVTEYLSTALGRKKMQGKEIGAPDLYAAVFSPAAIGKSMGSTIYGNGSKAYRANKSLDTNRDGKITKAELTARLNDWTRRGEALRG